MQHWMIESHQTIITTRESNNSLIILYSLSYVWHDAHLHFAAYVTVVVALGQGNTAGMSSHALCLVNNNLDEVHTRYVVYGV